MSYDGAKPARQAGRHNRTAVLLLSEDLDELRELATRLCVMFARRPHRARGSAFEISLAALGQLMTGRLPGEHSPGEAS